jgi:hypothetical protein
VPAAHNKALYTHGKGFVMLFFVVTHDRVRTTVFSQQKGFDVRFFITRRANLFVV